MSRSWAARKAPPTLKSLAEQLRDGPLKDLTALQDQAEALAEKQPTNDHELLVHLQSLVALATCSMTRFHEFTAELRMLVDDITGESALDSVDRH
jgi:signal transduction histidine kinase